MINYGLLLADNKKSLVIRISCQISEDRILAVLDVIASTSLQGDVNQLVGLAV